MDMMLSHWMLSAAWTFPEAEYVDKEARHRAL